MFLELSRFYTDPVIVLDFQSLYPSIIIAYNYCFSTCLGNIDHLGKLVKHIIYLKICSDFFNYGLFLNYINFYFMLIERKYLNLVALS